MLENPENSQTMSPWDSVPDCHKESPSPLKASLRHPEQQSLEFRTQAYLQQGTLHESAVLFKAHYAV
jgi:hypothetical protein